MVFFANHAIVCVVHAVELSDFRIAICSRCGFIGHVMAPQALKEKLQ